MPLQIGLMKIPDPNGDFGWSKAGWQGKLKGSERGLDGRESCQMPWLSRHQAELKIWAADTQAVSPLGKGS